jgi:hypothetical protein
MNTAPLFFWRHLMHLVATHSLFYLTNIVCHFQPLLDRVCGRSVEWAAFKTITDPTGSGNQYLSHKIMILYEWSPVELTAQTAMLVNPIHKFSLPKVHYCLYSSPSMSTVLVHTNLVHTLTLSLSKAHLNIPFRFSDHCFVHTSLHHNACNMPSPPHLSSYEINNKMYQ